MELVTRVIEDSDININSGGPQKEEVTISSLLIWAGLTLKVMEQVFILTKEMI